MVLSGLDIYKLLPKTNCKECGFATCLAFAMALAQKRTSLDKCPHVSAQAKEALESASQPPIRLVTIGAGETKLEIGNETVMYRHEQKFHHPAGIGFLVEDTLSESDLAQRIAKIDALVFERVGQTIRPDIVCLRNASGDKDRFVNAVRGLVAKLKLNLILESKDAATAEAGLCLCKERRPLILCPEGGKVDDFLRIANAHKVALAVTVKDLDEAAHMTETVKKGGVDDIVLCLTRRPLSKTVQDYTYIRRMALKKNFRALGYPIIACTDSADPHAELAEAITYVMKYAGIVIVKNIDKDFVLPLLVARQDLYTDPQKPVQVEPKIYEIGKVTKDSPVLITTNFSITYFTVAGEVESSKVPSYILSCDSEGMSVLTAWAAEKFTAESIVQTMQKAGLDRFVGHKKVIIPGYVAVLSAKLEDESGWKVLVGPREASGIPNYLRNWK